METNSNTDTSTITVESKDKPVTPLARIQNILGNYEIILGTNETTYLHNTDNPNEPVHAVGSTKANAILWRQAHQNGDVLRNADLKDINELLIAYSIMENKPQNIFNYVAKIDGGIEIDLGDEANTRIRITKEGVTL